MVMYTFLSVCLDVNHYIPIVYHLFPCYHLFLVGVNYFKCILFYFLIQTLSTRLYCVYVCSQFDLSSKSLQTCFLCTRVFSLDLNSSYNRIFTSITMPGHDHSIVPKLKPGDLGTRDAFFLWNCPIQDEGLSIRQHVIE